MDTPRQQTPSYNSIKSGRIPPPVHAKPRSNSLSADLENEPKLSNDETKTLSTTEKQNFSEIRAVFEKPATPETTPAPFYLKRGSIPASPTTQTNNSTFTFSSSTTSNKIYTKKKDTTKVTTSTRTSYVTQQSIQKKAKSTSPPPSSNELNNTLVQNAIRSSLNRVLNNGANATTIEEEEDNSPSPSPLPDSNDSSFISENNNRRRTSSVQQICNMFDNPNNSHVYQFKSTNRNSQPTETSVAPGVTQNARQPPPRPPPRPEKYLKSQLCGWHSVPSFDTAESIMNDSSHSSNQNLSHGNSSDVSFSDEEEDYIAERRTKLSKSLEEVYTTEKTYVNILYVLSVKLSAEIKNTCEKDDNLVMIFNNTYKPLLGTIQQIYQLHNNMILPEIEQYITGHSTGNMWSVLEKYFKAIEVLYKNYYVTLYDIQGKLDDLCKTHPLINEAMLKCQQHLSNLYPITQLNCPNQRLLRYILCMKTYLKYVDEHSAEYKHTQTIHDELDRIAVRCEEELAISAAQLNELKERLDNKFECIKDHRKLLWHGSVKKQSPRKHADIAQRYIILFSDCIVVCSEESGRKLDVKRELSMRGITVDFVPGGRTLIPSNNDQQNNTIMYYPFRVNAVEKSYEFLVDKESEREVWGKKIRQASDDYNKRNTGIEIRRSTIAPDEQQLGFRAPAWVNDLDVTRCQICNIRFPTSLLISTRRHHCRCCGRCICGTCSTKKLSLEYCKNDGEVRTCDTCYAHFTGLNVSKNMSIWPKSTREVDQTILFGDFRTVNSGGIIWLALQEDYFLHGYGARLDQAEDYSIKLSDLLDFQFDFETRTFSLRETTKSYTFTIDPNHQVVYQRNDYLDEKKKNSDNKLIFYTNLWYEAMHSARSTTLPDWYIRKRDSSDSGVSNVG